MPTTLDEGVRVLFARAFLKRIRATATDEMWLQRGTILRVRWGNRLVVVQWDHGGTSHTLTSNLVREDRLHLEAH